MSPEERRIAAGEATQRFTTALRARRNGRTQAEMARHLGLDEASMSRYLRGRRPSRDNARRIAAVYPELADVLTLLLLWEAPRHGEGMEETA